MMLKKLVILIYIINWGTLFGQQNPSQKAGTEWNLNFEEKRSSETLPEGWRILKRGNYTITTDSLIKHSGNYSVQLTAQENTVDRNFGGVSFQIPANYSGKIIELKGFLRLQDVKGFAGIFLKLEDQDRTILAYENMQMIKNKLEGTRDWKSYSIKLPYSPQTKFISVGALFSSKGTVWVDDLELFIDGRPLSDARPRIASKAELDTAFISGSRLNLKNLNSTQLQNLQLLGKVWGFLKYYHPAILKGDYNWDYELFRMTPKLLSISDNEGRNTLLFNWVSSLGQYQTGELKLPESSTIKMLPDFQWLNQETLGRGLYSKLEEVRKSKKPTDGYYFKIHDYVPVPDIRNEAAYSNFPYPDDGYRMLSLFRYWNIIQYLFPYKYLLGEDWNNVLKEFLPRFIEASSELEYKRTVSALISKIHDSHAYISDGNGKLFIAQGINHPALEISFIENKPVVIGFPNNDMRRSTELLKGDIIESIEGIGTKELVIKNLPYISASNYPTQLARLSSTLLRTNDSVFSISYIRNDKKYSALLRCYPIRSLNIYENSKYTDTCFRILKPGISYLNVGSVKSSYLSSIMKEANKTKALIIDLRYYPKEAIVSDLGKHLFRRPEEFVKFTFASQSIPGLFTFGKTEKIGKSNTEYYKGKVILLVNENTQSNGEFTAMAFRKAPNAIIIGSQTAGADGNVTPEFNLPGGIKTRFTGVGVYYPDGKETQRVGVVPDLVVTPTIKGIQENRDEILEKALEEAEKD